jgi:hypothetical protein
MTLPQEVFHAIIVGIGATAIMDLWLVFIRRIGIPSMNVAFIGRWVGHLFRGTFTHKAINKAEPMPGELALGWLAHYAIGIAFATMLVAIRGSSWVLNPTLLPAVATGVLTVLAPLCIMQPAMGAGFASSKTPTPFKNCLRSLANHTVFGLGLYLSAVLLAVMVHAT